MFEKHEEAPGRNNEGKEEVNSEVITTPEKAEQKIQEFQDKSEMVKISEDGDEKIQSLVNMYPVEMRESLTTSKYQLERLKNMLNNIEVDMNIPMLCKGAKCAQSQTCPLAYTAAPIGMACPLERIILSKDIEDYKKALEIDDMNRIELDRIMELAEADIVDRRASSDIATNGYTQLNIVGVTEDGKPVYKKEKSVAIDIKAFYKKKKDGILKEFLATRESQAKTGLKKVIDPSKYASDLLKRSRAAEADFEQLDDNGGK